MTRLEKMNIIKDSINNIINRVYGIYESDIITRIVNDDNNDELSLWYDDYMEAHAIILENPNDISTKYDVTIFYNDRDLFSIPSFDNTNGKYARSIVEILTGIDLVYEYDNLYISDLYNKLLEIKDYSDEELKLYFKLSS